jgi:hypothetical protein
MAWYYTEQVKSHVLIWFVMNYNELYSFLEIGA